MEYGRNRYRKFSKKGKNRKKNMVKIIIKN